MRAINPATEELIRDYPEHDAREVERRLLRAEETFKGWRKRPLDERAVVLRAVARLLRERREPLARLMAEEMGKPVTAGMGEAEKCAWVCEYYAENAGQFLAPESIATDASKSFVRYDPLGPVLAVMPWNFPFWQVFRFAAPALMAGNVGLLKHASNVPGCALAIEQLFLDGGAPEGAFTTLMIGSGAVGAVVEHPVVRAVTLTGSEAAGMSVGERAGRALKKTVLELGGSDPFVVLADADVERAATEAAKARTINSGQSCIAAKRFIVEEAIALRFEAALRASLEALRVGDPLDPGTDVGPLARPEFLEELAGQVRDTIGAGARLVTGGARLVRKGFFYPPTLLADVTPGMAAFDQETFGPVAAMTVARSAEEAIALANQSPYGLGASVWTGDARRGEELAAEFDAGCVFVNGMVKSDPRLPFGGVKRSGYGRELAQLGMREFVNVKTVWVK